MWIPLAVLAVLSVVGGWLFNIPKFLEPVFPLREGEAAAWLTWVSVAFGLGGIGLAYVFYVLAPGIPEALATNFRWAYLAIYNKYFIDEFYDWAVVEPTVDGSRSLLWRGVDVHVIDGAVNGVGTEARQIGGLLKRAQSGSIRNYAAWVVAGSILVIVLMGLMGGAR